jgi:hypothetical protein
MLLLMQQATLACHSFISAIVSQLFSGSML